MRRFKGISRDFRGGSQENGAFSKIIKEICKNQDYCGIFRAILLDFYDFLWQNGYRRSTQNGRKVYLPRFQQNPPNRLREMCVFTFFFPNFYLFVIEFLPIFTPFSAPLKPGAYTDSRAT